MKNYLDDEEVDLNNGAENTLDTARDSANEATKAATEPTVKADMPQMGTSRKPSYSDEEFLGNLKSGQDYSQDELNAMSDEQYTHYKQFADDYYKAHPTREMQMARHKARLALADELKKKADFIAEHTKGDEDYKDIHDEAELESNFFVNNTSKFVKMDDKKADMLAADINKKYEEANQRRTHWEVAKDAFEKGHYSLGNMIYQGGMMLKPGELTQENEENLEGSMQTEHYLEISNPQKIGGVENIHSVGDAVDWFLETMGENTERGLAATAFAAGGAYLGGAPGAIVLGTLGTMAMNTGEAVQDQMNEGRGNIRENRGWAALQGLGYSILDGAFGVSAWGGKIWANMLRRAGLKQAAKTAGVKALADTAEKASLSGIGKDILLHGVIGEGLQEAAQSQIVGRGVRWMQQGTPLKDKETIADAWLEAANEAAGGAAAGITFGLLGGAGSHASARYDVAMRNKIMNEVKDEKIYQSMPNYGKLLVTEHLKNDALMESSIISSKDKIKYAQSNKEIDDEIDRLGNSESSDERLIGQSAREYLNLFKSQYALEDLGEVKAEAEKMGISSSIRTEDMVNNAEERIDEKTGAHFIVYTDPNTGISISQRLDSNGAPTGEYTFNNAENRKMPIFSKNKGPNGELKSGMICKNLNEAIAKAQEIDIFNQWRNQKMDPKAVIANKVFNKLFGSRGVKLQLVDRPTAGTHITADGIASYDPQNNVVELDLGKVNNLGSLYTALVHERTHEDIVEFLLNSSKWSKKVGAMTTTDWDQFNADREELFSKVVLENGMTAEQVSAQFRQEGAKLKPVKKDAKTKHFDKVKNDWGKSAGIAGEEMIAERNSTWEIAQQLRKAERGIVGGILDKVRNAIGAKMAMDMGVNPASITPADVATEISKLFTTGYFGEEAPGFVREDAKKPETNGGGMSTEAFLNKQGDGAIEPSVNGAEAVNLGGQQNRSAGTTVTKATTAKETTTVKPTKNLKPQMKNGQGKSYTEGSNIRRSDGVIFTRSEDSWQSMEDNSNADDETATIGGYQEIAATPKASEAATAEKNSDTMLNAKSATATEKPTETTTTKAKNTETPKVETPIKSETTPETSKTPVEASVEVETNKETTKEPKAPAAVKAVPMEAKVEPATEQDVEVTAQGKEKPEADEVRAETGKEETVPATVEAKSETKPAKAKKAKVAKKPAESGPRKMPAKTKKKVVNETGLDLKAATEEVEDRWMRMNDLPDGAIIKVGSEKFTKTGKVEGKTDPRWESKNRTTTQFLLARSGDFIVLDDTPTDNVEVDTGTKDVKTNEDTVTLEVGEKQGVTPAEDSVRVSDNEDSPIEYAMKQHMFIKDVQRPAIREINDNIGEVVNLTENANVLPGCVAVWIQGERAPKIVSPEGKIMTVAEIKDLAAKVKNPLGTESNTSKRLKTVLSMPELERVKAEEFERNFYSLVWGDDIKAKRNAYTSLSNNKLLSFALDNNDLIAWKELYFRMVHNPNAGIQKYFKDKGIKDKFIPELMRRTWDRIKQAAQSMSILQNTNEERPSKVHQGIKAMASLLKAEKEDIEKQTREMEAWAKEAVMKNQEYDSLSAKELLSRMKNNKDDFAYGRFNSRVGYYFKDGLDDFFIRRGVSESDPKKLRQKIDARRKSMWTEVSYPSNNAQAIADIEALAKEMDIAEKTNPHPVTKISLGNAPKINISNKSDSIIEAIKDVIRRYTGFGERVGIGGTKAFPMVGSNGMNPVFYPAENAFLNEIYSIIRIRKNAIEHVQELGFDVDVENDPLINDCLAILQIANPTIMRAANDARMAEKIQQWRAERAKKTLNNQPKKYAYSADSFFYELAEDVWEDVQTTIRNNQDAIERAHRKAQREKDEAEAKRLLAERAAKNQDDDSVMAILEEKSEEEVRKERFLEEAGAIPEEYHSMSEKELLKKCVDHGGLIADKFARAEIIRRVINMMPIIDKKMRDNGTGDASRVLSDIIDDIMDKWENRDPIWSGKVDDKWKVENAVRAMATNYIKRIKGEPKEESLEARMERAGSAAESEITAELFDDSELLRDTEDSDYSKGNSRVGAPFYNKKYSSEAEYRERKGMFASPQDAVAYLVNSDVLLPHQQQWLKTLMDVWQDKLSIAKENLALAKAKHKHKKTIDALEDKVFEARKLQFNDEVLDEAAKRLYMLPKVFEAKLGQLVDAIGLGMYGKEYFKAIRRNDEVYDDLEPEQKKELIKSWKKNIKLIHLQKGMFTQKELNEKLKDIKGDTQIPLIFFDYNAGMLEAAMDYNDDNDILVCVKLAEKGLSNTEINERIKNGALRGRHNNGGSTAETLLGKAYEQYGWIDKRIGTKKRVHDLILKLVDKYRKDSNLTVLNMPLLKDVMTCVKMWTDRNMLDIKEDVINEEVDKIIREQRRHMSAADVRRATKEKFRADHDFIEQMMERYGDEDVVKEILQANKYGNYNIKYMFIHWNSVNRSIAKNNALQKERDEKKRLQTDKESGLTVIEKEHVDMVFNDFNKDYTKTRDYLIKDGWSKDRVQKAYFYLKYQERLQKNEQKTQEDVIRDLPLSQKREFFSNEVKSSNEGNEKLIQHAINDLGLDELTARTIIANERPVAQTMTPAELSARAADLGVRTANENDIAEITAEAKHEEAVERAQRIASITDKDREDAKRIVEILEKIAKDEGTQAIISQMSSLPKEDATRMAVKMQLSTQGLSDTRIAKMIDSYRRVKEEEEAKAEHISKREHTRTNVMHCYAMEVIDDDYGHTISVPDQYAYSAREAEERVRASLVKNRDYGKAANDYSITAHQLDTKYDIISVNEQGKDRKTLAGGKVPSLNNEMGAERNSGNRGGADGTVKASPRVELKEPTNGLGRPNRNGSRDLQIEPLDPEDAQRFREERGVGGERWHTRMDASDTNALFPARESQNAHENVDLNYKARAHKKDGRLVKEALNLLADEAAFDRAVERGFNHEPLTDVEIRAIGLDQAARLANEINGHLDKEASELNQKAIEREAYALVNGLSEVGAALQAAKLGVDLRTRDTAVYLKAQVRAQLEREIEKTYGSTEVSAHNEEIENLLTEKEAKIKEMADKMSELHAKIEEQQKVIARKEAAADERAIKRIADEARREGYAAGVQKATEAEKQRRLELSKKLIKDFGANKDKAERTGTALDALGDILGVTRRFAGNPESDLTDELRSLFAVVIDGFDGDEVKARVAIEAKYGDTVTSLFDQFAAEQTKRAVSPDGSAEGKKTVRKRNIKKLAEEAPVATNNEKVIEEANATLGKNQNNPNAWMINTHIVQKLIRKIRKSAKNIADSQGDDEAITAWLGEYARSFFNLSVVIDHNEPISDKIKDIANQMNRINGESVYDEDDAKDAILGRGAFKPINRNSAQVSYETLKKARKLVEAGKINEAAKIIGIEHVSDAEILKELDRRLGNQLNRKLNVYESRINEDNNEKLVKQISELIAAIREIRSGAPVGELLNKYLNLAEGMKDYRRQRSILERIQSRIDLYEKKLANNDFEPTPKRETPDNEKELRTIKHLEMDLERLRQRYKHERDIWHIKKEPLGGQIVSSIGEILGEVKALAGSFDLSSVLRQGGQMTWAHPILAFRNMKRTMNLLKSDERANEEYDKIFDRPNAKYYVMAGIDFTLWGDNSSSREDLYLLNKYRAITKMKLLKLGVECSERAFSMYLNLMRADTFDAMVRNSPFRDASNMTMEQLKALGNYINVASQRGMIDKSANVGKALNFLNTIFWSPRNIISRFQFLKETAKLAVPGFKSYGTTDMMMRKMFAKEIGRYLTGIGVAITFTKMMADLFRNDDEPPEDIVFDPRSSQFLEVKIGNTHLDFLSGLKQMIVFGSRFASGKTKTARGQVKDVNRHELIGKFMRSKFAPASGIVYDVTTGENFDKQDIIYTHPFTNDKDEVGIIRYTFGQVAPLSVGDVIEQFTENGIGGIGRSFATSLLAMLGMGANTYDSNTYKQLKGDYQYFKRLYLEADSSEERMNLIQYHPMLNRMGSIEAAIKSVNGIQNAIRKIEKVGGDTKTLNDLLEREKKIALNLMTGIPHPTEVD